MRKLRLYSCFQKADPLIKTVPPSIVVSRKSGPEGRTTRYTGETRRHVLVSNGASPPALSWTNETRVVEAPTWPLARWLARPLTDREKTLGRCASARSRRRRRRPTHGSGAGPPRSMSNRRRASGERQKPYHGPLGTKTVGEERTSGGGGVASSAHVARLWAL